MPPWLDLETTGLDFYRVQADKRWWRRKWQAEWPDCRWAQRGYTRPGIRAMARVRRSHPAVDSLYIRCRIMIRRCVNADRRWYRRRYDWRGTPRRYDWRGTPLAASVRNAVGGESDG